MMNIDKNTLKKRLLTIMEKIKKEEYPPELLDDIDELSNKIATDLGTDKNDAIAIIGFLFRNKFITIDSQKGLTIKNNEQTDEILKAINK